MPITVSCTCGKVFKVKDDQAGQITVCQVCGSQISTPFATDAVLTQPVLVARTAPVAPETITCPACAEDIPVNSTFCPACKEKLGNAMNPAHMGALVTAKVTEAEAYWREPASKKDEADSGGFLSLKSKILIGLCGSGFAMIVAGSIIGRSAEGLTVIGVMLALFLTIPVLVSLYNDSQAAKIQTAATPEKAFSRYLLAVHTNRTKKAYYSLLPSARKAGEVETIQFENSKIPSWTEAFYIRDVESFKKYWLSIFNGPSGQSRSVAIGKCKKVYEKNGVAVVEAELTITNHSQWLFLLLFMGVLLAVILITILQQKETRRVKKLLIKRGGKWFIAESELEGPCDSIALEALSA